MSQETFDLNLDVATDGTDTADVPGADQTSAGRPGDGQGRNGRAHRPGPWLILGAALILAGVVAAPEPPAEQVGIIDRVAEPAQAWEVEADPDPGFYGVYDDTLQPPDLWLTEQVVIYSEQNQVTAWDVDDGAVRWSATGSRLECHLNEATILCASGWASDAELVHLDTLDGELSRTAEPGLIAAIAVDEDIVTLHMRDDQILATRAEPGGEPVWSQRLSSRTTWYEDLEVLATVAPVGDHLMVVVRSGGMSASAILDAATGAEQDLPDGATLNHSGSEPEQGWTASMPDGTAWAVHLDGTMGDSVYPSMPFGLLVDDDVDSEVRFLQTPDELSAVTGESGEELWSVPGDGRGWTIPIARVGHVLVTMSAAGTSALDLANGEELWHAPTQVTWSVFSDTETLVQIAMGTDSLTHIIGTNLTTGDVTFEVTAAGERVYRTLIEEDRLVLLTDAGLSLWTW